MEENSRVRTEEMDDKERQLNIYASQGSIGLTYLGTDLNAVYFY